MLFLGAAVYAHGIDRKMKDFLAALDGSKVKKALQEKGVEVADETFYVKSKAVKNQLGEAAAFAHGYALF